MNPKKSIPFYTLCLYFRFKQLQISWTIVKDQLSLFRHSISHWLSPFTLSCTSSNPKRPGFTEKSLALVMSCPNPLALAVTMAPAGCIDCRRLRCLGGGVHAHPRHRPTVGLSQSCRPADCWAGHHHRHTDSCGLSHLVLLLIQVQRHQRPEAAPAFSPEEERHFPQSFFGAAFPRLEGLPATAAAAVTNQPEPGWCAAK